MEVAFGSRSAEESLAGFQRHREIMGATDPQKAAPGTIRADFAKTVDENAVHGSDSAENAQTEIAYFFKPDEICPRTR